MANVNSLRQAMDRILGTITPEFTETSARPIVYSSGLPGTAPTGEVSLTPGAVSGVQNLGTTGTTSTKSQMQLDWETAQKERESDPGYQAALAQAKASGINSVYRTNAPGAYAATSTPNAMGGYHTVVKRGPNSWGAWTAGTAPATPVYNAAHWESERAAANAVLAAENKRLGIGQKTTPVRTGGSPNYPGSGTWQQKAQYWKNLEGK